MRVHILDGGNGDWERYLERGDVDVAYLICARSAAARAARADLAQRWAARGVTVELGVPQEDSAGERSADLQHLHHATRRYAERRRHEGDEVIVALQGDLAPESAVLVLVAVAAGATLRRGDDAWPLALYTGPLEGMRTLAYAGRAGLAGSKAAKHALAYPELVAEAAAAHAVRVVHDEHGAVTELALTSYGQWLVDDAAARPSSGR